MRKIYFYAGIALAASVLMLSGCQKEADAPEEPKNDITAEIDPNEETLPGIPFEIIASTGTDTKTEMSGSNPVWKANDKLNVFYAPASTSGYSTNCEFIITSENLASKTFTGDLPGTYDDSASYDWFALYPYNSNISAPNLTSGTGAELAIGSANKSTNQVQVGNDNTDHLAGQYYPLYGKATAVTGSTIPSLTMKQALSVVKVHITNGSVDPLTVTSVAFTGSENITGKYFISFIGDEPVFTKKADGDVSSTANLTVTSGTPITSGNSADFYIAIKPFTIESGNLTVTVNGKAKKIPIASSVTFHPGKIKKINFNYVDCVTLDWVYPTGGADALKATINEIDGVTTSGLGSGYGDSHSPYRIQLDDTGDYFQIKTDKEISSVSVKYKMVGGSSTSTLQIYQSNNGSTWGDALEALTISGASNSTGELTTSKEFSSSARYVKIVFNKGSNVGIGGITIRTFGSDPRISADDIEVSALGATNEEASYVPHNFVGSDDVEVSSYSGCIKSAAIESGKIKYNVDATYGTADIPGTIVLTSASNSINKTVKVTQKGNTLSQLGATGTPLVLIIPAASETATINVTSSVFDWNVTATAASEKNLTIVTATEPLTYGDALSCSANESAQTITFHSSTTAPASGDPITLGTVYVYRNNNTSDPQKITITIKKASSAAYTAVSQQSFTFSSLYSNGNTVGTIAGTTNCSIVFDKGSNKNNAPKYYSTGTAVRVYGGNTITVTAASGYSISTITISFGSGGDDNSISADKGTYNDSTGAWSGTLENGDNVVFTVSGSSGNRRISGIQIN